MNANNPGTNHCDPVNNNDDLSEADANCSDSDDLTKCQRAVLEFFIALMRLRSQKK